MTKGTCWDVHDQNKDLRGFIELAGLRGVGLDIWDKRRTKIIFDRTNQDLMDIQEFEEFIYLCNKCFLP